MQYFRFIGGMSLILYLWFHPLCASYTLELSSEAPSIYKTWSSFPHQLSLGATYDSQTLYPDLMYYNSLLHIESKLGFIRLDKTTDHLFHYRYVPDSLFVRWTPSFGSVYYQLSPNQFYISADVVDWLTVSSLHDDFSNRYPNGELSSQTIFGVQGRYSHALFHASGSIFVIQNDVTNVSDTSGSGTWLDITFPYSIGSTTHETLLAYIHWDTDLSSVVSDHSEGGYFNPFFSALDSLRRRPSDSYQYISHKSYYDHDRTRYFLRYDTLSGLDISSLVVGIEASINDTEYIQIYSRHSNDRTDIVLAWVMANVGGLGWF